jgi:hypothetical protein
MQQRASVAGAEVSSEAQGVGPGIKITTAAPRTGVVFDHCPAAAAIVRICG